MLIQTARLRLRRFRPEDAAALGRWTANPEFQRYLGEPQPGLASIERYEAHWREHGFGLLAVEEQETGGLVGRCGAAYHRIWPHDPEVGWAIDPLAWGRGYATEAGEASIRWVFEELGYRRVVSICVPANLASRRVMEKLGFRVHEVMPDSPWGELWIHALDAGATGLDIRVT